MSVEKRGMINARGPDLWEQTQPRTDVAPEPSSDATLQRLIQELRLHQVELEAQNEALHEARRTSETALARYAELYEFSPVGYVTLNRTGVITQANRAATGLLHPTPSRMGSQRLGAFILDSSLPEFAVFFGRILGSRKTHCCEVRLSPGEKGETDTVVILEGRAMTTGQDFIVAIINITERKRIQLALQQAKDEAERANLAKSRFLAAASHDLRQPQQTLYLINGVMARRCNDSEMRNLIISQDQVLAAMSGMLNSLLDINQIEAGLVTPNPVGFSLAPLLDRLARDFAFQAGTGGNVWRVVTSSLTAYSDLGLLEQILRHLLSNAFKYTHHGKVLLGCRRHGSHLRIDVCDNGIGIAADQIDEIFQEFVQIDPPVSQQCRGLGLGLTLVQRQAGLLNHPLSVRSIPGRGSVFSIEVPQAKEGTAITHIARPTVVPPNAPILRRKIVVVEDNETICDMLRTLFLAEGAEVVTATGGDKLSAIIGQVPDKPDLIVTDYNLPDGLTGLDVVAKLRAETSADLPAIILTGEISTETFRLIANQSHCIHLTKPVTIAALLHAAGILLARPPRSASAAALGETVYVIDDDEPLCETLASLLEGEGLAVELYPHAEAFLASVGPGCQGCLLIDAVMPGMGGLQLLNYLRSCGNQQPAIMMTGHGDVATAVAAMKAGAIDFIAKPVEPSGLLATIARALDKERDLVTETRQRDEAATKISSLTPREYDVLEQLLAGRRNKIIAHCLGISQRTVENHRAAVMRKTKSKSMLDLLRTVIAAKS